MRHRLRGSVAWLVLGNVLAACASAPPAETVRPSAAVAAAPVVARGVAPVAPTTAEALVGSWVEFWSVNGRTDTQGYEFLADGQFEWRAAVDSQDRMLRRWGRYTVQGPQLVLASEGHEERYGCEGSAVCRVLHEPALEERFALGECPPNEEARAIDPSYTCVAIDGHAFWKQAARK